MPLVSSLDTVYTATAFAWRSLTAGTIFPLFYYVETLFPVFGCTLPILLVRQKACVYYLSISACVFLLVLILLRTSTNYVNVPELL